MERNKKINISIWTTTPTELKGNFLYCFLFLTILQSFSCKKVENPKPKPNIILILADDLGWSDLGCYGNTFHETPNIDKLAETAIRFTDAYASASVCSPTRASILTGKYPTSLQLTDWLPGRQHTKGSIPSDKLLPPEFRMQLGLEEKTIAEYLREGGYTTANIGKWHLGGMNYGPENQGFDINLTGSEKGSPPSYFYPYESKWNKGNVLKELQYNGVKDEYLTDRLTSEAIAFMKENKERPFFLYLPHYAVHTPLMAKDSLERYYIKKQENYKGGFFTNPIYAGMVQSLDEGVGRIMDTLKELGMDKRTIVIFTSDNGGLTVKEGANTPATNSTPLKEGKGYLGEGGVRVPLLIRWPNLEGKGTSQQIVTSPDLLPTLLEGLGYEIVDGHFDGQSFYDQVRGNLPVKDKAIFWHYPHYSNQGGKPSGAVREGDFKLIEHYEDGYIELFNLKDDIGESRNLASRYPKKVTDLLNKLNNWRIRTGAKMPTKK